MFGYRNRISFIFGLKTRFEMSKGRLTVSFFRWKTNNYLQQQCRSGQFIKYQVKLVLDSAICLADCFEFTIDHCARLKAFRHERASLNRIAADKLHSAIVT